MGRQKRSVCGQRAYVIDALECRLMLSNSPPVFTSGDIIIFQAGVFDSFTIRVTGTPTPVISEQHLRLPAGITFADNHDGTATFSGTPSAADAGAYFPTIIANNGVGGDVNQFVALDVDVAPIITSGNGTTFKVGDNNSFTFTATALPKADFVETGALPSGVTFLSDVINPDSSTATLSGIPAAGTEGLYPLTITATTEDNANFDFPVATKHFTLVVGRPPAFTNADSTTFTVGTAGTFTFTTSAFPAAELSLTTLILPAGLTFTNHHDGTATLALTPTAGEEGDYPLTIDADNGVPSFAQQTFTLHIVPLTSPPTITSGTGAQFAFNQPNSFTFRTTGIPAADLSVSGDALPAGVTFVNNNDGTATLSGIPADPGVKAKLFQLTITADNGVSPPATQSFRLVVVRFIEPEFTSASGAMFLAGTPDSFTITTSGFPAANINVLGERTHPLPSGLTLTSNGDGTATLSGSGMESIGVYSITLEAANVESENDQTFTLTVGQKPAFTSGNFARFLPGAAKAATFAITTVGFPAPTITETGKLPQGLSFAHKGSSGAQIVGKTRSTGVFPITLTAKNDFGSVTQTVMVLVGAKPKFTSAATASFNAGARVNVRITASGLPLPKIAVSGNLPPGLTLQQGAAGQAVLNGKSRLAGTIPVTLTATSGSDVATQTLVLKIQGKPSFTSANSETLLAGVTPTFIFVASAIPAAKITLKGSLPPGLKLHDNGDGTASLTGMPTRVGTYQFAVLAKNKFGSANQVVTLNVISPVVPEFASATTVSARFDVPFTFNIATVSIDGTSIAESGTLPGGVTFTDNGDGRDETATLSGTPASLSDGTYPITFTATDKFGGTRSQNFTLTVVAPLAFPIGMPDGSVTLRYPKGEIANRFTAFAGGAAVAPSVASADFNNDGVPDIVVGAGAGDTPVVKVINGKTGEQLGSFSAFDQSFLGGVLVGTGDVNGDGVPDILVSAGAGSAQVRIFDGTTFTQFTNGLLFNIYPGYTGGLSVAAEDFSGDGKADIITVQNKPSGGTPVVQIFSGGALLNGVTSLNGQFTPFDSSYTGGAAITTGDVNGDGHQDILISQSSEGTNPIPAVTVVDGRSFTTTIRTLAASSAFSTSGVIVSTADIDGDGKSDIILTNAAATALQIFSGADGSPLSFSLLPS